MGRQVISQIIIAGWNINIELSDVQQMAHDNQLMVHHCFNSFIFIQFSILLFNHLSLIYLFIHITYACVFSIVYDGHMIFRWYKTFNEIYEQHITLWWFQLVVLETTTPILTTSTSVGQPPVCVSGWQMALCDDLIDLVFLLKASNMSQGFTHCFWIWWQGQLMMMNTRLINLSFKKAHVWGPHCLAVLGPTITEFTGLDSVSLFLLHCIHTYWSH